MSYDRRLSATHQAPIRTAREIMLPDEHGVGRVSILAMDILQALMKDPAAAEVLEGNPRVVMIKTQEPGVIAAFEAWGGDLSYPKWKREKAPLSILGKVVPGPVKVSLPGGSVCNLKIEFKIIA